MESSTGILIEGARELVDGWGNLQASLQDGTLTLETNVERPLDVTGKVTLGLDVSTDGEVAGLLLEEWVGDSLGGLSLSGERGGCNLLWGLYIGWMH